MHIFSLKNWFLSQKGRIFSGNANGKTSRDRFSVAHPRENRPEVFPNALHQTIPEYLPNQDRRNLLRSLPSVNTSTRSPSRSNPKEVARQILNMPTNEARKAFEFLNHNPKFQIELVREFAEWIAEKNSNTRFNKIFQLVTGDLRKTVDLEGRNPTFTHLIHKCYLHLIYIHKEEQASRLLGALDAQALYDVCRAVVAYAHSSSHDQFQHFKKHIFKLKEGYALCYKKCAQALNDNIYLRVEAFLLWLLSREDQKRLLEGPEHLERYMWFLVGKGRTWSSSPEDRFPSDAMDIFVENEDAFNRLLLRGHYARFWAGEGERFIGLLMRHPHVKQAGERIKAILALPFWGPKDYAAIEKRYYYDATIKSPYLKKVLLQAIDAKIKPNFFTRIMRAIRSFFAKLFHV